MDIHIVLFRFRQKIFERENVIYMFHNNRILSHYLLMQELLGLGQLRIKQEPIA